MLQKGTRAGGGTVELRHGTLENQDLPWLGIIKTLVSENR